MPPQPISTVFKAARRRALELAVILALVASSQAVFSVDQAVQGGAGVKLFVVGRMVVLVLVATLLLRRTRQGWVDLGLRTPKRWWTVPLGAAGCVLAASLAAAALSLFVLPALGLDRPEYSPFLRLKGDLAEYFYWLLPVVWGSAALGEELIFRGFVLDRLRGLIGLWPAIVGQAAVFGVLHLYQGAGGALVTATTALVLGLGWLWSGRNLWTPIVAHGLLDTASMTAFYLGAPVAQG